MYESISYHHTDGKSKGNRLDAYKSDVVLHVMSFWSCLEGVEQTQNAQ